jgi:hypothetical protein
MRGGIMGSAGGRFFGWLIGGSLLATLAADWLTSTWDQNAALLVIESVLAHLGYQPGDYQRDGQEDD